MANTESTVFVSNISLKANTKTVSDFFSFCGKIVNLVLRQDNSGQSQQALVIFETDSAAKTALLLTNALIVDKVIQVVSYNPNSHGVLQQQSNEQQPINPNEYHTEPEHQITNRDHQVPDAERSKTSIIASVIAAGYSVGSDALTKAKTVDEEHMISLKLKVGAEAVKAKANEINNKLHISENAVAIKNTVVEKAKVVDERFQISGFFSSAGAFISQQTSNIVAKVNDDNAFYSPFVQKVSDIGTTVGSTIKQEFQQIQTETSQAIDEKKREKGLLSEQQPVTEQQQQELQETNIQQQQQQQQEEFSNQL